MFFSFAASLEERVLTRRRGAGVTSIDAENNITIAHISPAKSQGPQKHLQNNGSPFSPTEVGLQVLIVPAESLKGQGWEAR